MYNNELIRLVGLVDPETHSDLVKSFDFYKKESEDNKDFYEKQFGIERKVVNKGKAGLNLLIIVDCCIVIWENLQR